MADCIDVLEPAEIILLCDCGTYFRHNGCAIVRVEFIDGAANVPGLSMLCDECGTGLTVLQVKPSKEGV